MSNSMKNALQQQVKKPKLKRGQAVRFSYASKNGKQYAEGMFLIYHDKDNRCDVERISDKKVMTPFVSQVTPI